MVTDNRHFIDSLLERINKNIQILSAEKGIKKSELEIQAGVTPGYLSRFKPGSASLPASLFLIELSKILEVSLDDLIFHDFSEETTDLIKPLKVVSKLLQETNNGVLKWKSVLETEIKEGFLNKEEVYCEGFLLNFEPMNDDFVNSERFFKSKILFRPDIWGNPSLKDYSCWLNGTIYAADMGSSITFMLIPMERVQRDSKKVDRAIGFFVNKNDFIEEQFTISKETTGVLQDRLFELYRAVERSRSGFSRSKNYDSLFDLYLSGKSLDEDDTDL